VCESRSLVLLRQLVKYSTLLLLADLRAAMQLRHPTTMSTDGTNYLSLQQKELVEFGYGSGSCKKQHCLGLLAPGDGKSECYIIPTIARHFANHNCKTIIHISPYNFLAGYQFANALSAMKKLGLQSSISMLFLRGRDIQEGALPEQLAKKEHLPSLIFLNLDGAYNLFTYFLEDLKSCVEVIDKIVIDEVHTVFSELSFRQKYQVYFRLPVLGIPIMALSGSVPLFALSKFARRLCLSDKQDLSDMKVIHGSHLVGTFPKGFKIKVAVTSTYVNKVASFVLKRLGSQPGVVGAVHIFVSEKADGEHLLRLLSCRYNCRFVSSDTTPDEVNQVALNWSKGKYNVLISTSIALVGNENPHCRYLACAGYLYDLMQIVQACGRLRHFMRDSTGQILFSVPDKLSDFRIKEDQQRFTRLVT
jgi:superfamily II DNA helicase RecQ